MKYTAQRIVERALNLADISNTDFLTHEEQTQYINDAWQTVFNWIVNKGDSAFIAEVPLENGYAVAGYVEYEMPKDLYIIKSISDPITGNRLHRKASTESVSSNSYEIVNDRIRIYGAPSNLTVSYWKVPEFISFPERTLDVSLEDSILDSCSNSVLYSNGNIVNLTTNETLGTIAIEDNTQYILGNGYVISVASVADEITVMTFEGTVIRTFTADGDINWFKDSNGAVYYQTLSESVWSVPYRALSGIVPFTSDDFIDGYPKFIAATEQNWIYYNEVTAEIEVWCGETFLTIPLDYVPVSITVTEKFNNNYAFYTVDTQNKVRLYWFDDDGNAEYDILKLNPEIIYAKLKYGIVTNLGLYSVIPDTDFNFPNELYISLLACDLALRYAMKMNANTDGLNNLYMNMQTTFMNSLSQDADYPLMAV